MYTELTQIYKQLEEEVIRVNPTCDTCGTCCNFGIFDHVLYTSGIEVDFITRNVAVPDFEASDNVCPFLKDKQCSIRDYRTLGCRVFYCNPPYQETSHALYEKYYHKIKELSIKYNVVWEYQPFLKQLAKSKPEDNGSACFLP
jgi:Fe-S-cluster containining protein